MKRRDPFCWVRLDNVYVGLRPTIVPVEIFDNYKQAIINRGCISQMLYRDAVQQIRRAVFVRDNWTCTHCGATVTWDGPAKGEMHERAWRGRGGNISLDNSTTLCYTCHQLDPVAGHGKRQVHWQK